MREIKFRMWDFENNVMIQPDVLAFEEYAPLVDLLNQKGIMQFTGLYDKNGNEIFEGDIVKIPNDSNVQHHGEYSWYDVVNKKGQWFISYLQSSNGKILPKGYLFGLLMNHFDYNIPDLFNKEEYCPTTEIEIVGNVYELLPIEKGETP